MQNYTNSPENLWDDLLSRDQNRIQSAFTRLNSQEKIAVLDHLRRMATEPGWHPEQCESARAALSTLGG